MLRIPHLHTPPTHNRTCWCDSVVCLCEIMRHSPRMSIADYIQELDFLHEASNARRCAANLASPRSRVRGRVAVPEVLLPLSSHRVLTMEFVEGVKVCESVRKRVCKCVLCVCGAHQVYVCIRWLDGMGPWQVTDVKALREMGIAPHAVAQLVSQAFNEMIFTHGDVHCDPHAVCGFRPGTLLTKHTSTTDIVCAGQHARSASGGPGPRLEGGQRPWPVAAGTARPRAVQAD